MVVPKAISCVIKMHVCILRHLIPSPLGISHGLGENAVEKKYGSAKIKTVHTWRLRRRMDQTSFEI